MFWLAGHFLDLKTSRNLQLALGWLGRLQGLWAWSQYASRGKSRWQRLCVANDFPGRLQLVPDYTTSIHHCLLPIVHSTTNLTNLMNGQRTWP